MSLETGSRLIHISSWCLLVFLLCFAATPGMGQVPEENSPSTDVPSVGPTGVDPTKRPQDSLILGVNVDSVSILVTARNRHGDYIGNLNADDFQIFEDGEEQPIRYFRQDTIPVNVVFLVDTSYSVDDVLQNIIDAAVTFAGNLRSGDKYAAVIFAHKPIRVLDWTDNLEAFQNIMRNVKTFGKTALYDSMAFTVETMFDKVQGKKAIILLTDGVDNSSTRSLEKVMRLAAEHEVTIYPIIHANPESERYRDMAKNNRQKLQHVSKYFLSYVDAQNEFLDLVARNGGRIIFSNGYTDLKNIYGSLVEELKNQYTISYVPQVKKPSEKDFKEVTIRLRNQPGAVFVRLGYFQ